MDILSLFCSDIGISVSKMEKVGLVFYTVPNSLNCKRDLA